MGKVVLVTVNIKNTLYGLTSNTLAAIAPNIPLGLLDAYLNAHDVPTDLIDSEADHLSIPQLLQRLLQEAPDLVGVIASGANPSASTMSMVGVLAFFQALARLPEKPFTTFVWGPHPTVLPERTLRETGADFIVLGEGYEAIAQLYRHVCQGISLSQVPGICYRDGDRFVQHPMPPLVVIDDLPLINWDKMPPAKYRAHNWHCFGDIDHRTPYGMIWTNQGCPYPCEFCSVNNLYGKRTFRFRSMQKVVAEIDLLVQKHGVRHIKILDELFLIHHHRIDEFCTLLEERQYDLNLWCFARTDTVRPQTLKRLKKIGVNWVAYGFESSDQAILDQTQKRSKADVMETIRMSRDAGMNICADVIVGFWEDDDASILKTRDFLFENLFEWINIYPLFLLPGTPWYNAALQDGRLTEPETWDRYGLYSYDCTPMHTRHLTAAQVLAHRDQIFHDYFHDPAVLTMLEQKFGPATRLHVAEMTAVKLRRKLLGDS